MSLRITARAKPSPSRRGVGRSLLCAGALLLPGIGAAAPMTLAAESTSGYDPASVPAGDVRVPGALDPAAIEALARPMMPSKDDAPQSPPAGEAEPQPLPPDQSALIDRVFAPEGQR